MSNGFKRLIVLLETNHAPGPAQMRDSVHLLLADSCRTTWSQSWSFTVVDGILLWVGSRRSQVKTKLKCDSPKIKTQSPTVHWALAWKKDCDPFPNLDTRHYPKHKTIKRMPFPCPCRPPGRGPIHTQPKSKEHVLRLA